MIFMFLVCFPPLYYAVYLPRDVADGCDEEQVRSAREEMPQEGIHP
jgi:hypothetical protein